MEMLSQSGVGCLDARKKRMFPPDLHFGIIPPDGSVPHTDHADELPVRAARRCGGRYGRSRFRGRPPSSADTCPCRPGSPQTRCDPDASGIGSSSAASFPFFRFRVPACPGFRFYHTCSRTENQCLSGRQRENGEGKAGRALIEGRLRQKPTGRKRSETDQNAKKAPSDFSEGALCCPYQVDTR